MPRSVALAFGFLGLLAGLTGSCGDAPSGSGRDEPLAIELGGDTGPGDTVAEHPPDADASTDGSGDESGDASPDDADATPDAGDTDSGSVDSTPTDTDGVDAADVDISIDPPAEPRPHLVLVHGYLGRGADWDSTVAAMVNQGWERSRVHAPSLGNTNDSIIELAGRLDTTVAEIVAAEPDARIDIVGHSLGGPVVRWWVTQMGGWERAEHVMTIAGANQGNDASCLTTFLGESSEQLCPAFAEESDSVDRVMWTLNGGPDGAVDQTPNGIEDGGHIRWSAVAFSRDPIIVPWQSSCLDISSPRDCSAAVNTVVDWSGVQHVSLIRDARFVELLADFLQR